MNKRTFAELNDSFDPINSIDSIESIESIESSSDYSSECEIINVLDSLLNQDETIINISKKNRNTHTQNTICKKYEKYDNFENLNTNINIFEQTNIKHSIVLLNYNRIYNCPNLILMIRMKQLEEFDEFYKNSELYESIKSSAKSNNYFSNTIYDKIIYFTLPDNRINIPNKYLMKYPFSNYSYLNSIELINSIDIGGTLPNNNIQLHIIKYLQSLFFWNGYEYPELCIKLIDKYLSEFENFITLMQNENWEEDNQQLFKSFKVEMMELIKFIKNFKNKNYFFNTTIIKKIYKNSHFDLNGLILCCVYNNYSFEFNNLIYNIAPTQFIIYDLIPNNISEQIIDYAVTHKLDIALNIMLKKNYHIIQIILSIHKNCVLELYENIDLYFILITFKNENETILKLLNNVQEYFINSRLNINLFDIYNIYAGLINNYICSKLFDSNEFDDCLRYLHWIEYPFESTIYESLLTSGKFLQFKKISQYQSNKNICKGLEFTFGKLTDKKCIQIIKLMNEQNILTIGYDLLFIVAKINRINIIRFVCKNFSDVKIKINDIILEHLFINTKCESGLTNFNKLWNLINKNQIKSSKKN